MYRPDRVERLLHDSVLERRIRRWSNTLLAKGRRAGPWRSWAGSLRPCHAHPICENLKTPVSDSEQAVHWMRGIGVFPLNRNGMEERPGVGGEDERARLKRWGKGMDAWPGNVLGTIEWFNYLFGLFHSIGMTATNRKTIRACSTLVPRFDEGRRVWRTRPTPAGDTPFPVARPQARQYFSPLPLGSVRKHFPVGKASRSEHGDYDKLPRLSLTSRTGSFNGTGTPWLMHYM